MKLGKLVAKGVAEDVLDTVAADIEEPRPAPEPKSAERVTAERVTAGSSAPR